MADVVMVIKGAFADHLMIWGKDTKFVGKNNIFIVLGFRSILLAP